VLVHIFFGLMPCVQSCRVPEPRLFFREDNLTAAVRASYGSREAHAADPVLQLEAANVLPPGCLRLGTTLVAEGDKATSPRDQAVWDHLFPGQGGSFTPPGWLVGPQGNVLSWMDNLSVPISGR
jgi:hypothetical protein